MRSTAGNGAMADRKTKYRKDLNAGVTRRSVCLMLAICALTASAVGETAQQTEPAAGRQGLTMKIRIILDDRTVTGTLADNPTARDFASLLPLTLTLTDYASTEKISDLPRRLSRQGAPDAIEPAVGDITYYAPWGNLAIFHRDFRNSPGLIRLGTLDAGTDVFARPGAMRARIELADNEREQK
jgi:hypothetical protein